MSLKNLLVDYFSLSGFLVPQDQAEQEIREGVSFRGINMLILITAIFIASLGLNTNSTAVIIGAMLISPLMGPIVGLGLGVGIYDFELIKRSLRNLLMATAISVLTSTLYFIISPVSEGHSELLARTSPTIYDVLIAFFGGAAGILAAGSKFKGNVVPGVAIATALMPPLCTAGYGLATWQLNYFFGAFYLFLINSVYIALATFIGVKLMHYHGEPVVTARVKRVRRVVLSVALVVMLPSIYLTWSMLTQSTFQRQAARFVAEEFHFPATQVVSQKATMVDGQKTISVTLIGRILPTDSLMLALQPKLKNFGLAGAKLNIIQGDMPSISEVEETSARDIYQFAQTTISQKQHVIDSLKDIVAQRNTTDTIGASLAPEIRVLFPQISDIAVTQSIFGNINTQGLDTVNIAMVKFMRPMGQAEQKKFNEYLCARLNLKSVYLVEVGRNVPLGAEPQDKK